MGVSKLWELVKSRSGIVCGRTSIELNSLVVVDASVVIHSLLAQHFLPIMTTDNYTAFIKDFKAEVRSVKRWAYGTAKVRFIFYGVRLDFKKG